MSRVPRAGSSAFLLALVLSLLAGSLATAHPRRATARLTGAAAPPVATAAVAWPVSALLVSEVQTGGSSASDEFAEITNGGSTPLDLNGLELVYVTSTGSTVTRKQTWTQLTVGAHRHLLIANSTSISTWPFGARRLPSVSSRDSRP